MKFHGKLELIKKIESFIGKDVVVVIKHKTTLDEEEDSGILHRGQIVGISERYIKIKSGQSTFCYAPEAVKSVNAIKTKGK